MKTGFELLGLALSFELSEQRIDQAYREAMAQVHPDRGLPAAQALALNQARSQLKDPVQRAKVVFAQRYQRAWPEPSPSAEVDFLERQLELREQLDNAADAAAYGRIEQVIAQGQAQCMGQIGQLLAHADTPPEQLYGPVVELEFWLKLQRAVTEKSWHEAV